MPAISRRTALAAVASLAAATIVRAQQQEWVIGAPLPITGGLAPDGAKQQRGYQFWADTVNAAGGVRVAGSASECGWCSPITSRTRHERCRRRSG